MQTALYDKIKEKKGEWLIGAKAQNRPYLSIVTTQHKTRQRRVRYLSIRVKTPRHAGAQTRINIW